MSRDLPPVIELFGLPAAGKTTAAALLHDELGRQGRRPISFPSDARELGRRSAIGRLLTLAFLGRRSESVMWAGYRIVSGWGTLSFVLTHPRLVTWLAMQSRARPDAAAVRSRRPLYWLLRHVGDRALFRRVRAANEVLVADEGFAHRVVQLFASPDESPKPADIDRYLPQLEPAEVYVRLGATAGTAAHRLEERGTWGWLAPDAVPAFMDSAGAALDLASGWLARHGRPVVDLDNDSIPPAELPVRDVVEALFAGRSPIRVLMVSRLFHPWVGGMERQALKLATTLQAQGVEVAISTGWWFRHTPRREVLEGVEVVRNFTLWEFFGVRGIRRLGHYLYMATLALHLIRQRRGFDVIHVHGLSYHTFVASRIGRLLHKPVIAKLANSGSASDIRKLGNSSHLPGTAWMLDGALACDRLVAISEPIANELMESGVEPDRITRIPNGVDLPDVRSDVSDGDRLLFVGRLHPQKDLTTLLEALALMPERSGLAVDVVGDGPDRLALERRSGELGLASQVEFHGETGDVEAFFARATALVLPSLAEGLSNSLLEAMSAGLPAVVSDIPANTAVVEHGVEGLVFAAGDAQDLASCLMKVLDDPELRGELGRNARRTVEARYAIGSVATQYRALYRELLARSRS